MNGEAAGEEVTLLYVALSEETAILGVPIRCSGRRRPAFERGARDTVSETERVFIRQPSINQSID